MNSGNQVVITGGAYEGFTGVVTELDGQWVFLKLRSGELLWLAASLVRPCGEMTPPEADQGSDKTLETER